MTSKLRKRIWEQNEEFGRQAYRNLGIAYATIDPKELLAQKKNNANSSRNDKEKNVDQLMAGSLNFTFVGLFALWDPPREEVLEAIDQCKSAGIKVVMITGDQEATAVSIAKNLEIYKKGDLILTGADLDILTPERYNKIVDDVVVYTRVSPKHKMQIVEAFQNRGETVAMTGDGINDAPALAKADIGVAMGKSGTDVARDSSSIILMDDNFSTIVAAIEEGRKIYNNIKRFVRYQISTNVGAIFLISLAVFMTEIPIPLFPVQILWINIIMDGPPAIALGMEKVTQNVMKEPPRSKKERILSSELVLSILTLGLVMAWGTIFLFTWAYDPDDPDSLNYAKTMAFTVFVVFQLFNVLNCKSQTESVISRKILENKFLIGAIIGCFFLQIALIYVPVLQTLFHTVPLSLNDWLMIVGIAFSILVIEEAIKLYKRHDIAEHAKEQTND
jgi:Ca2+-transporting ATPase